MLHEYSIPNFHLDLTEFCKTNYQTSVKNEALTTGLSRYISERSFQKEYTTSFEIFGKEFNFGYSQDEKIQAAKALIQVLLGNKTFDTLAPHQGALSNGKLDSLVRGQPIKKLIDSYQQQNLYTSSGYVSDRFKQEIQALNTTQATHLTIGSNFK
ncbi:hypothetical protein BN59_01127 [Legionella massiliensis]|uniref:Uncharacterized protein n=1 Tax=Legionella massiliensis TaxID=1034943 RepID=A0A078KUZ1_9GAMM|nr:hypothetical protein [Legionella massiliensis]CDZ76851.1 hypothetical protein BN59_01127 [Legionella massiliensis]CEE12589.1 hypothetical protein BN1094_01127 [Legionella massiliensis]